MSDPQQEAELRLALSQLEQTANNFALRLASMAGVRARYVQETREMSQAIWRAYRAGEISASIGAATAHQMRNQILDMARAHDMDLGRAYARRLKSTGLELDQVIQYIMNEKPGFRERFAGRAFSSLSPAEQVQIYEEVIQSAGRSRTSVTQAIPRLRWAARGLWVATAAIAIYNVGTSQTPWWQAGREGANLGGGLLGSIGGGAAMGAAGGVWAGPIGVGVGILVGGVLGALLADRAYVEIAGTANPRVRGFVGRFTSFFTGTDESGMARALATEYGRDAAFILEVLGALEQDYSTDADDVAYALVGIARREPAFARTLTGHVALRATLIRLLESGYVAASEREAARWLRAA